MYVFTLYTYTDIWIIQYISDIAYVSIIKNLDSLFEKKLSFQWPWNLSLNKNHIIAIRKQSSEKFICVYIYITILSSIASKENLK